jgi:hypothetical protein
METTDGLGVEVTLGLDQRGAHDKGHPAAQPSSPSSAGSMSPSLSSVNLEQSFPPTRGNPVRTLEQKFQAMSLRWMPLRAPRDVSKSLLFGGQGAATEEFLPSLSERGFGNLFIGW